MSNQQQSAPRVMFFQAQPQTLNEPAATLQKTVHEAVS